MLRFLAFLIVFWILIRVISRLLFGRVVIRRYGVPPTPTPPPQAGRTRQIQEAEFEDITDKD